MPVPSLKEQRLDDLSLIYHPDNPWVYSVAIGGEGAFSVLARAQFPETDNEGEPVKRDLCWIRVRRSDWENPAYRDPVTLAGQGWRMAMVTAVSELEWRIKLEKDVRHGFGGR